VNILLSTLDFYGTAFTSDVSNLKDKTKTKISSCSVQLVAQQIHANRSSGVWSLTGWPLSSFRVVRRSLATMKTLFDVATRRA